MHHSTTPARTETVRDTRPATSARFAKAVVRRLDRAPELRAQDLAAITAALKDVRLLDEQVAS